MREQMIAKVEKFLPTVRWYPFTTYKSTGDIDSLRDVIADFAIEQVKAERKRIAEKLRSMHYKEPFDVGPENCWICKFIKELEAE